MNRRGFTLTEILIVVGIIVLLLALAVPAFNMIRGSRSVDAALNQVSALLGRARSEAIGLQRTTGVMFFHDPRTNRTTLAMVYQAETPLAGNPTRDVYLDLVPDVDFLPLTPGVSAQVVDDQNTTNATDDRYLGYNTALRNGTGGYSTALVPYGGVILFSGSGRLISSTYGFRIRDDSLANPTAMATLLFPDFANTGLTTQIPNVAFLDPPAAGTYAPVQSQIGLVLYDDEAFRNNGGTDPDQQITGGQTNEITTEETWLDNNATPILINRYNGTLLRGQGQGQ